MITVQSDASETSDASVAAISRTVVPGVLSQIASLSIKFIDSKGVETQKSATTGTATIQDLYPGAYRIEVTAYADAARTKVIAEGAAPSVTVVSGTTVPVTIPMILSSSISGTGSIALPISFPANIGITSVTASFPESVGTVSVVDANYATGTATLSGDGISGGAHTLTVSFCRNGSATAFARIFETVNVRTGLKSDTWVDATGALKSIRTYEATELYDSRVSLASLSVGGVNVALQAGNFTPAVMIGALDNTNFILTGAFDGQTFSYTFNGGPSVSITGGAISPALALAASGPNTLIITVTASDGVDTGIYTVTVNRSWTVRFNTMGGSLLASQIAPNGSTVSAPANPAYAGFQFEGWYKNSACTIPWVFGTDVILSDTTLYAKWTESGIIRITVGFSTDNQFLVFSRNGKPVTSLSMDKDAFLSLAFGSGASGYRWYIDGREATDVIPTMTDISDKYVFKPSLATPPLSGTHSITATALKDGFLQSGSLSITVCDDSMIPMTRYVDTETSGGYLLAHDGGVYKQYTSTTTSFIHHISPFSIGKYEVSYPLWYTVYSWAIANGYTFQNQGQEGTTGTPGDPPTPGKTYPVTNIAWVDMIVWCNAYSRMSGLQPCYYVGDEVKNFSDSQDAYLEISLDGYRLPTEAEWQFASSCGDTYPWNYASGADAAYDEATGGTDVDGDGNARNISDSDFVWYDNNSTGAAHECGTGKPNCWGIFDMSGNVWEITFDGNSALPTMEQINYFYWDPTGVSRTEKGGAWNQAPDRLHVGYRTGFDPMGHDNSLGFRLARKGN